MVQRNAQGISPLRQYLCHHAARISEATSVFLQFSGVETEIELNLARSGIFVKPENISEMTVCPLHQSSLGIGWRKGELLCRTQNKFLNLQKPRTRRIR